MLKDESKKLKNDERGSRKSKNDKSSDKTSKDNGRKKSDKDSKSSPPSKNLDSAGSSSKISSATKSLDSAGPNANNASSSKNVSKNLDSAGPNIESQNEENERPVNLVDIMSVLQGMRADQAKSDKRIDELSNKVNDMYEYEEYDEDELLRDDEGEGAPEPSNVDPDENQATAGETENANDDNNEPPAKKQKTDEVSKPDDNNNQESMFKAISQKFKIKEKVDVPVDQELADIINGLFASGLPEAKLSELLKNTDRPENCNMLNKTIVNRLIWDLLSDYTRSEENRLQYKHGLVIKAAILLTKMLDKLNTLRKDMDLPTEIFELGTDALGLMGHFHRITNMARREMHRYDLSPEYFHLCSTALPYNDNLYGDDVSKKVSDIDSVNKVGKKVGLGRGRGGFGGRTWRRLGRAGLRRGGGTLRGSYRYPRAVGRGGYNNVNFNYQNPGYQNDYSEQSSYDHPTYPRNDGPKNFRRRLRRRRP